MREILFRGKRTDNGEWITGFYARSGDKAYILADNDIAFGYVTMKEVMPETVGQYTGLTDKNGTKIFEGDILSTDFESENRNNKNYSIKFSVVTYGEFNCECCGGVYGFTFVNGDIRDVESYTIIGNIYDNPELLRSDTE